MKIEIIEDKLSKKKLCELAVEQYGEMIKAVVDIGCEVLAVGGELHADAEAALLENGSEQQNLWGINIYPTKDEENRIEYTSFINIRPRDSNRQIEIKDKILREKIRRLVDKRINWDE